MKRTTLVLEEGCMEAVRQLAARESKTISEVVNTLLVEGLQRRSDRSAPEPFRLPKFRMGRPRVDLGDRDALESVMER